MSGNTRFTVQAAKTIHDSFHVSLYVYVCVCAIDKREILSSTVHTPWFRVVLVRSLSNRHNTHNDWIGSPTRSQSFVGRKKKKENEQRRTSTARRRRCGVKKERKKTRRRRRARGRLQDCHYGAMRIMFRNGEVIHNASTP